MKRKPSPAEVKLRDKIASAQRGYERCYIRMRRSLNAMEKFRRVVCRCRKQLANLCDPATVTKGGES